jgi:ATPase subunit of ABC transporter with duplicated ATPase domains
MQRPPGTLAARHVTRSHGAEVVLEDVSLVVPPRARIGVIGPNGIGKSTLLRLLAGLEPPDAGRVERSPATLTVGYLPQEADLRVDETLLGYLARRTGVQEAERELDDLAARLEGEPELAERHADALSRFLALGGEDLEARARAVCRTLGLPHERLAEPAIALSGGQAARAALAAILLARFDVLLLDEPTNDLDFDGLELLDRFLAETPAAVVLVSHDRTLLDSRVDRVVELAPGSTGTLEYAGGFGEYERLRDQARRRGYEAWDRFTAERGRLEEQARRRAQWVERAGTQRRKKKSRDIRGQVRREIERLEAVEKPFEPWELRVRLRSDARGGDVVARLESAVVERGAFRLGPVDLVLGRQDRLAVLGPNGSGKTTLLRALLGDLPLAEGRRTIGAGVVLGELEQGRQAFSTEEPLLETYLRTVEAADEPAARTALAKFGLGTAHVLRPCASLSPGERTRAALASFMARGANLLVLDEPTNHLDLPAIEQLEAALASFDGTAVVVSHDRRFLERFGATRTLELPVPPNQAGRQTSRENPVAPSRAPV